MKRPVIFTPEAVDDLKDVYLYIEPLAGYEIATNYTNAILTYCRSLEFYPVRGEARDDLGAGYRVLGFKRRASVVYKWIRTRSGSSGSFTAAALSVFDKALSRLRAVIFDLDLPCHALAAMIAHRFVALPSMP